MGKLENNLTIMAITRKAGVIFIFLQWMNDNNEHGHRAYSTYL